MARNRKPHPRKNSTILAGIGFLLVISGITYLSYRRTVVSFAVDSQTFTQSISGNPKPVYLKIPSIDVASQVIEAHIRGGIWDTSSDKVSHLAYSKNPGDGGNIVLYAHNTRSLLSRLPDMTTGDIITLTTDNGKSHYYTVRETMTVTPEDIENVLPTGHEVLTIYTCTGFLDTKRFIVKAVPLFSL